MGQCISLDSKLGYYTALCRTLYVGLYVDPFYILIFKFTILCVEQDNVKIGKGQKQSRILKAKKN